MGLRSACQRAWVRPPGEHPVLVWNIEPAAVAAAHSVDPDRWSAAYGAVVDLIAPRFARHEPLRPASSFMLGLLSSLERKNCWTISEARGRKTPYAFQHLLSRASWDADACLLYTSDAADEEDS